MKICVCGKGGSGKSTVVSLLAKSLQALSYEIIVLDSDESNTSLYWMLGLDSQPESLMELAGGKQSLKDKMLARFKKGQDEPAMQIWDNSRLSSAELPEACVSHKDGLRLVTSGKIRHAGEGCACPMGGIAREFVKNFKLAEDEIMLVDTEAGIEHFGRGVEAGADMVLSVVEPSLESINLAHKVMELTAASGARYAGAILNKFSSPEQAEYMRGKLNQAAVPILGAIELKAEIQSACLEGRALNSLPCADEILASLLIEAEAAA